MKEKQICCSDQVWLCLLNHRDPLSPQGKSRRPEAAGDEQQPGRRCHKIIAALLKLGEDEIAYINPVSVFACISGDPNRGVQAPLAFSSLQGPDPVPAHANQAVLSCLLMEANEKKMAEFPGERGSAFPCLALPIIHPLHNLC